LDRAFLSFRGLLRFCGLDARGGFAPRATRDVRLVRGGWGMTTRLGIGLGVASRVQQVLPFVDVQLPTCACLFALVLRFVSLWDPPGTCT